MASIRSRWARWNRQTGLLLGSRGLWGMTIVVLVVLAGVPTLARPRV